MPNKTVDEIRAELDKEQPTMPAPPHLGVGQSLGLGFAGATSPAFQHGVVSPMIAQRQNFGASQAAFQQGQREAQVQGLNQLGRTEEIGRRTDVLVGQEEEALRQQAQMDEAIIASAQTVIETDQDEMAGARNLMANEALKADPTGSAYLEMLGGVVGHWEAQRNTVMSLVSAPGEKNPDLIQNEISELARLGKKGTMIAAAGLDYLGNLNLAQMRAAGGAGGGGMTPKDTETYRASAQMLEGAQLLEKLLTDPESDIMFLGRPGGAIEGGWLPGWAQNSIDYIARLGEESPDGKSRYERNAMIDAMMGDIGGMFTVERGGKALTGTEIKIFGGAIPQISENPIKNIAAVRQIASFARGRMEAIEMGAQIGIAREQFRDTESFTQALRSRGINVPTVEGHNEDGSFIMSSGASAPAADNIEFRQEIPGGGGGGATPPPPARESPSFAPLDQSRMGQASETARRSVAPVSPVGSLFAPIGAAAGAAAEGVHRTLVPGVDQPSQPGLLGPVDPGVARTLAAQARKKRGQ